MDRWRKYTPQLQAAMQAALEQVSRAKHLSKDVAEVINKSLSH
jgi:aminopeptidase N